MTVSPEYGQLPQAPELKLCIARTGGEGPTRTLLPPKPGASSGRYGAPGRPRRLSWGCDQIDWLPNPSCHQGVCASTLMGRHKTATRLYRC